MPPPDDAELLAPAAAAIAAAGDLDELRTVEQAHLGRRSALAAVQRELGGLPEDRRRDVGERLNRVRAQLRARVAQRRAELEAARDAALLEADRVDVTLPGRVPPRGATHPITRTTEELIEIFIGLGYRVVEGPEVETDWFNFEALNMPPAHPARSMWDTMYLADRPDGTSSGRVMLRTHTSPVQVRAMLANPPPVYVVIPGRCYRRDTADATHLPVFHQLEGLAVDHGITMGDLKGTLLAFARAYFGADREIRLRPDYFPFTEPSAEVDVSCFVCGGRGVECRTCHGSGWIELLGAGMVHPNVLLAGGYDPDQVSGFAFGTGIERPFLLRSGLEDMRALESNDLRWLAAV